MGSLVSETQIRYFRNDYSKRALKNYTKGFQPCFPYSLRTSCPNFKKSWRHSKKTVIDVCFHVPSMPYFRWDFPFSKRSKSTRRPKKGYYIHYGIYKLYKVKKRSTRSCLGSKTQALHVKNNYSMLALKNYIGVLQHGLSYSVSNSWKNLKNLLK